MHTYLSLFFIISLFIGASSCIMHPHASPPHLGSFSFLPALAVLLDTQHFTAFLPSYLSAV